MSNEQVNVDRSKVFKLAYIETINEAIGKELTKLGLPTGILAKCERRLNKNEIKQISNLVKIKFILEGMEKRDINKEVLKLENEEEIKKYGFKENIVIAIKQAINDGKQVIDAELTRVITEILLRIEPYQLIEKAKIVESEEEKSYELIR